MDPGEHRVDARDRWEAAAKGWGGPGGEAFMRGALPVAHRMVEAIAPQPGQTVLELAGGSGDVGFLAAELLKPGGKLIETDGAEAMVEVARARGERLASSGVEVEYRTMELEWIDAPTASIDAIVSRFGYMHAVDPEAGLREARRVLRSGGRLAIAVWDGAEHNPWLSVVAEELIRAGHAPPPVPGQPGAFALSEPGALHELLADAAFEDIVVEPVDLTFTAPSLDDWWQVIYELSSSMRPVIDGLSPADRYTLRDAVDARWEPWVGADGVVSVPGRALCASAAA
jgi:SAM-dependent methyltransferase